ncbi:MAG: anaerobic glycerol-3-phosphate dehydrogenase subunit C [Deltaproteobacteria bacterium]|nr:anaerobic glycerol-3-phosphate dehydrogenase subunit C [Deltaproteobacteria bacterium]
MNYDFQHCIRCTVCVANCPVFKVNQTFPGPKQSGPDAERFRSEDEASVDQWVQLCSQCRRCEVACPYGVNPAEIILREQTRYGAEHFRSLPYHLFANNYWLGAFSSLVAPLVNIMNQLKFVQRILHLLGLSTATPFPPYRFHSMGRSWRWRGRRKSRKKVVFFYGCFINYNRPDIGRGVRDLLASLGVRVVIPRQVCCGLPALGNGDIKTARTFARKNARVLVKYIDKGYDVIYTCTSGGLALTHDYPGILDVPGGKKIAENTYNLHEYILKLMEEEYIAPVFNPVHRRVAYHIPCHLRALGIGYPAARLFERIPGLEVHILEDNCCGLSGSYGFKKKNEETSTQLGTDAARVIKAVHPDVIMSDCGACRMQLEYFSGIPAFDPSEILRESLQSRDADT